MRSDPYHGLSWDTRSSFQYDWDGDVDKDGKFHGTGSLNFSDGGEVFGCWRNGVRVGKYTTSCPAQNIKLLSGEYTLVCGKCEKTKLTKRCLDAHIIFNH